MIDHLGVSVKDHAVSRDFYVAALAPLGITVVMEVPRSETGAASDYTGLGSNGKPYFWIGEGPPGTGMHLAFVARTRMQVDAFHAAALKAGARDNGPPGLRPHYHEHYYGAFVIDPNGINLEAVCHEPA